MQLISVNVGLPRTVPWQGKMVTTSIFKEPVAGAVMARTHNLDGDRQADLSVHGGPYKAIYVYPSEHYAYWRGELPDMSLRWGMFGENFTTEGLLEERVNIGDHFRIGTAEFVATEPRLPCYKLGVKFGRTDMVKRFLASRRTGFYLAVVQPGLVAAEDAIAVVSRDSHSVSVADITRVYAFDRHDRATMRRIIQVGTLSEGWRSYFEGQLAQEPRS